MVDYFGRIHLFIAVLQLIDGRFVQTKKTCELPDWTLAY